MKTLLLFLVLLTPNCHALNLGEIRTDVRSLITDGQGTRQRFSDSEISLWLNEGQKIADIKTLCTYKAVEIPLVAGVMYYTLPSDFLMIQRVTLDYLAIQELTPAAMDSRSSEWENISGEPTYYFMNFSSRTRIGFTPFPAVAADLGTAKVEYIGMSTTLSSDTDVPFGGQAELSPYQYSLIYYAAYKASMIDERDSKAKVYLDSFTSLTAIMKELCTQRPNYRPSAVARQ